ncbi:MAG: RNA polymerase sigma factor [Ruminococcus sp.]|nr:RNA polymerase sigma factor [Ruminococcus sp.]
MDEKLLVRRASGGDKEAFAALYMRYRDDLYRYAYFRLGNEEDARDAVSACIVEAYEGIFGLRNASAFKPWIFRILYRCCCRLMTEQSQSRNNRADVEELQNLPAENDHVSPEVKEAFGVLNTCDRDIVLLSVIGGYSSFEIAEMIGLKPSTVRSRLKRALAKMKQFLE